MLESARILYGLIHARYILTAQGLSDMVRHAPHAHVATPVVLGHDIFPPPSKPGIFTPARKNGFPASLARHTPASAGAPLAPSRTPLARSSAKPLPPFALVQKVKYKAHEFGSCPRTLCEKQTVLPVGLSDFVSHNGNNPMKLFCPRCQVALAPPRQLCVLLRA